MGYYVETSNFHGKSEEIAKKYDGEIVDKPVSFDEVPSGKALIVVMNNGAFEAAGYAFNADEFAAFTSPNDLRPKKYALIDRVAANRLTGYKEKMNET